MSLDHAFLYSPLPSDFLFCAKLLLFPSCPESTGGRHFENVSVQLENIRQTFSSFGSDARACQPVTGSLNTNSCFIMYPESLTTFTSCLLMRDPGGVKTSLVFYSQILISQTSNKAVL